MYEVKVKEISVEDIVVGFCFFFSTKLNIFCGNYYTILENVLTIQGGRGCNALYKSLNISYTPPEYRRVLSLPRDPGLRSLKLFRIYS